MRKAALFLAAAIAAGILILLWLRAARETPLPMRQEPALQAPKRSTPGETTTASSRASSASSPAAAASAAPVSTAAKIEAPPAQEIVERSAFIRVTPAAVNLALEHGRTVMQEIELENVADADIYLTIYKLSPGEQDTAAEADRLLAMKRQKLSEHPDQGALAQTASYAGAPWLSLSPAYTVIPAGGRATLRLLLNAAALADGEHRTQLVLAGSRAGEVRSVPVAVAVKPAPILRMESYQVADGGSAETSGDQNRAANPGETVTLSVNLENFGSAAALGLKLELSSDDPAVEIISSPVVYVEQAPPQGQALAAFKIHVSEKAHATIPPTVYLTTTDQGGRQWFENFYLGEDGSFEYPTGAVPPKEDEAADITQRSQRQP